MIQIQKLADFWVENFWSKRHGDSIFLFFSVIFNVIFGFSFCENSVQKKMQDTTLVY